MDIEFFLPQGPHPTEMEGLEEMRRILPKSWKGFANFVMRQVVVMRVRGRDYGPLLWRPPRRFAIAAGE